MTLTDDGSILFPSITICKNEMYNIFDKGLIRKLETGELSVENAKPWLRNRTFSRQNLVRFLSIKTEEGSNKYPCNAVGGPRAGEPCTFPVMYPDCKLIKKNAGCKDNPGIAPVEYLGCDKKGLDNPWCSTKTYHNRSRTDNLLSLLNTGDNFLPILVDGK